MCGNGATGLLVTAAVFAAVCLTVNIALMAVPWYTFTASLSGASVTTTFYLNRICGAAASGGASSAQTCSSYSSQLATLPESLRPPELARAAGGGTAAIAMLGLSLPFFILLCISASIAANNSRSAAGGVGGCGGCFAGRAGNISFSVAACALNGLGAVIGWATVGAYANFVANDFRANTSNGVSSTFAAVPGGLLAGLAVSSAVTALCCAIIPFCSAQFSAPNSPPAPPTMIVINPASPGFATGQVVIPASAGFATAQVVSGLPMLPQPEAFAAGGAPPPPPLPHRLPRSGWQCRTRRAGPVRLVSARARLLLHSQRIFSPLHPPPLADYYDAATNATSWTPPPGAALAPTPQPAASSASEAAAPAAALWQGTPLPSAPGTAQ